MNVNNDLKKIDLPRGQKFQHYDPEEAEVARKLGMSYKEFSKLSEEEKMEKVREYNELHPDNPIKHKGADFQGEQMAQFRKDVNWANIKLQ